MTRETPRPVARAFSCLVKGPLGCLAFVIGAVTVGVLAFPPIGGRLVDRWSEARFAEHFEGRLELGDAWVGSLYGRQIVERVVLRDPGGEEVLSARLWGPSFEGVLDGGGPYGPVHLAVDHLRLVLADDGATNLDRALTPRPDRVPRPTLRNLRTDVPLVVNLAVEVARARLEGPDGTAESLAGLAFTGRVEWTPAEIRLRLEGGATAEPWSSFRLDLDAWWSLASEERWAATWTLRDAPAALAGVGLRPLGQLARFVGARVDRVEARREGAAVEARVVDDGRDLALRGRYRRDPAALVGEGPQERLELAVDGQHLDALAFLLPLVTGVRAEGARAWLAGFEWSLEGRADASGSLRLELAASDYELAAALPRPPDASERLVPAAGSLDRELAVRHGRASLDGVGLPLADGRLVLHGFLDLASAHSELSVRLEAGGTSLDLGPLLPAPVAPRAPRAPGR